MKILVTGGAGFIGSHIVDNLLGKNCQVVVADDLSAGRRENVNPAAQFHQLDIAADDLLPLLSAEKFDAVVHLAAQTTVAKSLEAPDFDCRVNILGTVRLLEACRKTGVGRIVFASSAATYGNVTAVPISEDTPAAPESFYGLSKLAVEKYLKLYRELYGLSYVILRYANVYGERQGDAGEGGVISIFARRIAAGQLVEILGDGGQTRDFVYAGDVAEANYRALVTTHVDQVYNISTSVETKVSELVTILAEAAERPVATKHCPPRAGDIYRSALANRIAMKNLDWRPAMPLREGLAAVLRSLS